MDAGSKRMEIVHADEPAPEQVLRVARSQVQLTRQVVDDMKEQMQLFKDLKMAVLSITMPGDWQDFNGTPHLKESGVNAVAAAIALEFDEPEVKVEEGTDERGKWRRYTARGGARWRGITRHDIGTASTREVFFARAKGRDVPFEGIDLGDVEKKSITNLRFRLLTKLFPIGGTTWVQLQEIGVIRGVGGTTRFKGQEAKMVTGAGVWTPQKERIWGLLLELNGGDDEAAATALHRWTHAPARGIEGRRDPAALSQKQVDWLLPRIEKEYAEKTRAVGEMADNVGPVEELQS